MSSNSRKISPKVANFEVVLRDVNQIEVPSRNSAEKKTNPKSGKKTVVKDKMVAGKSGKFSSESILRSFNTKPFESNKIPVFVRNSRSVDKKSSVDDLGQSHIKLDAKAVPADPKAGTNDNGNDTSVKLNSLNLAESEGLLINVLRKSAPTGYNDPTPSKASPPNPPLQHEPRILQRTTKQNGTNAGNVDPARKKEIDIAKAFAKEKEKARALDQAQKEKEMKEREIDLVRALDLARKEQAQVQRNELEDIEKNEELSFMSRPTMATVAGTFKYEENPKCSTQHFREFTSKLKLPTAQPTNYKTTKNNSTTIHIRKDLKNCLESKVLILHTSVEDIHKIGKIILKDANENREIFLRPKMKRRKGQASKA